MLFRSENNPSFEVVLKSDGLLLKEEDEAIMPPVKELVVPTDDKENELLQNEYEQMEEDETVMSHGQKLVATHSRKELACSNSREKIGEKAVWQTVGAATAVEN